MRVSQRAAIRNKHPEFGLVGDEKNVAAGYTCLAGSHQYKVVSDLQENGWALRAQWDVRQGSALIAIERVGPCPYPL